MTDLAVPSRQSYVANLQTGTVITGTISIDEKSIKIAPVKSGLEYTVTEAGAVADSFATFPTVG